MTTAAYDFERLKHQAETLVETTRTLAHDDALVAVLSVLLDVRRQTQAEVLSIVEYALDAVVMNGAAEEEGDDRGGSMILFPSPCCHAPSTTKRATDLVLIRVCTTCGKEFAV
jgi:hypothetical protein